MIISICPPGFKVHRADRSNELANKKGSGGGICFLINERWCSSSTVISKFCSHDLELKKFHLNKEIMGNSYRAIIESILTFSTIMWFNSLRQAEKRKINSIVIQNGTFSTILHEIGSI